MTTEGIEDQSRTRPRWDFREVNVLLVVILAAITGVLALVGWWWRPGSSAYPPVSRRLALTVYADARSLVMTVRRVGDDGAELTLYDDDRFGLASGAHGVTPRGWRVGIDGLGRGRVLRRPGSGPVPIPAGDAGLDHTRMMIGPVHVVRVGGLPDAGHVPPVAIVPDAPDAPLYLRIRWAHHAPVGRDGAYLSAQLPGVVVDEEPGADGSPLPMDATLLPAAGDVGGFSIQASEAPTVTAFRSWTWRRGATSDATQRFIGPHYAFDPVAFTALNVSETQHENVRTFFVGVLLGVAGGAVLGLILELVKIRRRADGA
jgi:hypothetical protein